MANAVAWFEVAGRDQPALKGFYGELFGWEFTDAEGMPYSMVDTPTIGGGIGAAPDGGPGHVTFYVQVDSLESALEQAEGLGGSKVTDPMEIPGGGRIAHFTDPEGHFVGMLEPGSGS
jgi:uncharacterized protein